MIRTILGNFFHSFRPPHVKEVFFRSLRLNRKILFWYADKLVSKDSIIETVEQLKKIDQLRRHGKPCTFMCNHLSYADSHIIETLLLRFGFDGLASHLIHIAGQKTYKVYRRFMTRSLNTIRVYQPKAEVDKTIKKKMNARALKWAAHLNRRGYSILVFPEGTRSRRLRRFNIYGANPKGTIYFRHSYVVPLALMGSENIMPVGKWLQRRAIVKLRVGETIDYDATEKHFRDGNPELSDPELRLRLMLHFMNQINSLLDEEYRFQGR